MDRIKIQYENEKTIFSTKLTVLVNHLNYFGHLGYDAVFSIIQDARIRFLQQYEMTELSIDGSIGYMVVGAFSNYLHEAFIGDALTVSLYVANVKRKLFTMLYQIKNQEGDIVAVLQTDHIFLDFKEKKIVSSPERFSKIFM